MPEPSVELVRALRALADQTESWEWHAPVGPGNASYANGYEHGRRAAGADLRALLAAYPPATTAPERVNCVADYPPHEPHEWDLGDADKSGATGG